MDALTYIRLEDGGALPSIALQPFKVVIIADTLVDTDWLIHTCRWLVNSGCLYCIAWGESCELWHDAMHQANVEDFLGVDIPDDRFVMTTWHSGEPLEEALWFAAVNAHHPTVELSNTVMLHVGRTDRKEELRKLYVAACNE